MSSEEAKRIYTHPGDRMHLYVTNDGPRRIAWVPAVDYERLQAENRKLHELKDRTEIEGLYTQQIYELRQRLTRASAILGDVIKLLRRDFRHPEDNTTDAIVMDSVAKLATAQSLLQNDAPVEQVCEWREDDEGTWHASCGTEWQFTNDGPVENDVHYCMGCGKPIKLVAGEKQ